MLTKGKDLCGHCLEDRRLVLPDAYLCMYCDATKKAQDRAVSQDRASNRKDTIAKATEQGGR